ncbi:Na(+)-translocating NADH-quinone reductase subunit A [Pseudovibrio brasiliensis]|uniref:Na(+)-translocating NADH-quinone reductase subunit A n=1 Tax=Pseudovibrio brasiliensis TaxID=1898042 RepID=A0ABX8AQM8_9HYPH|nr:Na(+)-translocating NADH-quinone reductase subunit A [Pseudovibrio brasiliensis]QUS55511.1 Na(+)-translocating NADH-quinone reductase subunit A [Pseudovibrio brasiliensis]
MKITKGLDLPITGAPNQEIHKGQAVRRVAVNGGDYNGLKPRMLVAEGDRVVKGQPLFIDKRSPEINYVAPGAGVVEAVNRGARRVLETIVIKLDGGNEEQIAFSKFEAGALATLDANVVREQLAKSGLWTSFRTRPYSKVPVFETQPRSIFVTAMDTNPLAADAGVIINANAGAFEAGLQVVSKLTDGRTFVCHSPKDKLPGADVADVQMESFEGKHPAGNAGTHIHFLDPVNENKTVWTIGYQDVMAIGNLFLTGELDVSRVVSVAGPLATKPRLVTTRVGADLTELLAGETLPGVPARVVSGSILSGTIAEDQFAFLGRYHTQVTLMEEDRKQDVVGWVRPFMTKWSNLNVHPSGFFRSKLKFPFGTNKNGSIRAIVPLGTYEKVMPLDVLPTQLLRALMVLDTDMAQKLGALELDEEDLALCTFICHSKNEYGAALRANLDKIEKEG